MGACGFPKAWLQAWLDGEAGEHSAETRDHLSHCPSCAREVEVWRSAGDRLRSAIDAELGEIEPLVGLRRIRERIDRAEQRSLGARLRAWWSELWLFHRPAVAGVVVAAALGALVAPGVVYLVGRLASSNNGPLGPAVVVESLEVGNNSTAVVLGEGETTTLIWVEPGANGVSPSEESF